MKILNDIIGYIENVTNIDCTDKSWTEIVDDVILPHMADRYNTDTIDDKFMNFLAEYPEEVYQKDAELASVLMEIALKRLSAGAVIESRKPHIWELPEKYRQYSSRKMENFIMTGGCLNFVLKALNQCLHDDKVRDHAEVIVFGLISNLSADGKTSLKYTSFMFNDYTTAKVYYTMENLASHCFDYKTLFNEYARPQEWRKHLDFFSTNYYLIDWEKFFEQTKAGSEKDVLDNIYNRQAIKKEIKEYGNSLRRHH